MSGGSDASILGYGNQPPFSNINPNYVNVTSSNNPYHFGSNEISGLPGLSGAKVNTIAAKGIVPGICNIKGGAKSLKRRIKKISSKYKMNRKKSLRLRSRLRKKYSSKKNRHTKHRKTHRRSKKTRHSRRRQRGGDYTKPIPFSGIPYPPGYHQYQNNDPITPSYSTGGVLSKNDIALANPVPYQTLSNNVNCVDNYDHFTGKGFPSRGH
jgi:hypothetical protein